MANAHLCLTLMCLSTIATASTMAESTPAGAAMENRFVRYAIAADGSNLSFYDKTGATEYCLLKPPSPCAHVKKAGREYHASRAAQDGDRITLQFGDSGVQVALRATPKDRYILCEVLSINDEQITELVFADIRLTIRGKQDEPFGACALALNLQTRVPGLPGTSSQFQAMCYPRFGLAGAKVAIIGCPQGELRQALKDAVSDAPDLPHSPLGGPWALEAPINQGSYLFNFGGLSEQTVDKWIETARSIGMNQIDFHGGSSFRFGDIRPNPETYPRGIDSLKAVIEKLHAADIKAGLHTYAFFIDKSAKWVTPVPDPRLGKDATFTLAQPMTAEATTIPVVETTEKMSTTTGFFIRNSVTLQIGDELITYTGITKQPPYGFTGCKRGALGTRVASHEKGAKVHHLKECFGLFVPDGDSTLFTEVAARTAEVFNEAGFDMMYLDALDGQDLIGGWEAGWHYGSKFVFEIFKRLKRPALMEMSIFHHHLWTVRSRYCAWDHPNRGYKKFIDIHCAANEDTRRMFLPGHLGWWAVKTGGNIQVDTMFADDIEYLCCKAIGTDTGFSLMGIDPGTLDSVPAFQRFSSILKNYESLRHANYFPSDIKARMKVPGDEFTLSQATSGGWELRPVQYLKHKVEGLNNVSNLWRVNNKFGRQPARLRIEALMSVGPYDAPGNVTLTDFSRGADFAASETAPGITALLSTSSEQVKVGTASGCFTASRKAAQNSGTPAPQSAIFTPPAHGERTTAGREPSWAKIGRKFSPELNLAGHEGLGLWIHGDGQGEVLNFQLRSPERLVSGIGDHYVPIDFTGWRYVELVEPESDRTENYAWPYSNNVYGLYREIVHYSQVEAMNIWYNQLPEGKPVRCYLSPIRGLPLVKAKLTNPTIIIGDRRIAFPTSIESGCYLEYNSMTDCKLYGPGGELLAEVTPKGEPPTFEAGENQVKFTCEAPAGLNARAKVTTISIGEKLPLPPAP